MLLIEESGSFCVLADWRAEKDKKREPATLSSVKHNKGQLPDYFWTDNQDNPSIASIPKTQNRIVLKLRLLAAYVKIPQMGANLAAEISEKCTSHLPD